MADPVSITAPTPPAINVTLSSGQSMAASAAADVRAAALAANVFTIGLAAGMTRNAALAGALAAGNMRPQPGVYLLSAATGNPQFSVVADGLTGFVPWSASRSRLAWGGTRTATSTTIGDTYRLQGCVEYTWLDFVLDYDFPPVVRGRIVGPIASDGVSFDHTLGYMLVQLPAGQSVPFAYMDTVQILEVFTGRPKFWFYSTDPSHASQPFTVTAVGNNTWSANYGLNIGEGGGDDGGDPIYETTPPAGVVAIGDEAILVVGKRLASPLNVGGGSQNTFKGKVIGAPSLAMKFFKEENPTLDLRAQGPIGAGMVGLLNCRGTIRGRMENEVCGDNMVAQNSTNIAPNIGDMGVNWIVARFTSGVYDRLPDIPRPRADDFRFIPPSGILHRPATGRLHTVVSVVPVAAPAGLTPTTDWYKVTFDQDLPTGFSTGWRLYNRATRGRLELTELLAGRCFTNAVNLSCSGGHIGYLECLGANGIGVRRRTPPSNWAAGSSGCEGGLTVDSFLIQETGAKGGNRENAAWCFNACDSAIAYVTAPQPEIEPDVIGSGTFRRTRRGCLSVGGGVRMNAGRITFDTCLLDLANFDPNSTVPDVIQSRHHLSAFSYAVLDGGVMVARTEPLQIYVGTGATMIFQGIDSPFAPVLHKEAGATLIIGGESY